jgi:hypothetical protein
MKLTAAVKLLRRSALIVPAAAAFFAAAPADAAEEVDLALVLAVDVSRSMDFVEQRTQRDGYVRAFRDPEVIKAIQGGAIGRISVSYVEWSGPTEQLVVAPWTTIADAATANAFADMLAKAEISRLNFTSIAGVMGFAARFLDSRGPGALRRVIDISGDGPNNVGGSIVQARQAVLAAGISINGLPVMLPGRERDFGSIPNLDQYYRDCVIGGPNAFMLTIRSLDEFASATRRKLILEIAANPDLGTTRDFIRAQSGEADCGIGERMRQPFYQQ